jgi:hypothetical protein
MTATLPSPLETALKEWAIVCQALSQGRQIMLLRKGGIYESGGEFELEHRQFLFFPTYLHQNRQMLKADAQEGYEPHAAEPATVTLGLAGQVTDIIQLKSRAQADALDDQHVWTAPLLDMRFNYKPENPLYLLLVRAFRLPRPVVVENTPGYAGCKSWVPLDAPVDTSGATPALDEGEYRDRHALIRARLDAVGA